VATYQAIVVAPVSLRKLRRVGMIAPPVGTYVAVGRLAEVEAGRRPGRNAGSRPRHERRRDPGNHLATSSTGVLAPTKTTRSSP
jgi:hypothetical protein